MNGAPVASGALVLGGGAWIVATALNKSNAPAGKDGVEDPIDRARKDLASNKKYLEKMGAQSPPTGNFQSVAQKLKAQLEANAQAIEEGKPVKNHKDPQNTPVVTNSVPAKAKLPNSRDGRPKVSVKDNKLNPLSATRPAGKPATINKKNDSFLWVNQWGTQTKWIPIATAAQIGPLRAIKLDTTKADRENRAYSQGFPNVRSTYSRGYWQAGQWDALVIRDWIRHVRAGTTMQFAGRARAADDLAQADADYRDAVKAAQNPGKNYSGGGDGTGMVFGSDGKTAQKFRTVSGGIITRPVKPPKVHI